MFKPCDKCENGYIYSIDENGQEVAGYCQCKINYNNILESKMVNSYLGIKLPYGYTFDKYLGEKSRKNIKLLKAYVDKFGLLTSSGMYVSGEAYTQKSTCISYLCNLLSKRKYDIGYVTFSDVLFDKLIYGFSADYKPLEDLLNKNLIVIDSFLERIEPKLMYKRYKDLVALVEYRLHFIKKPIILISQLDLNDKCFFEEYKDFKSLMNSYNFYNMIFKDNYYQESKLINKNYNYTIEDIFNKKD